MLALASIGVRSSWAAEPAPSSEQLKAAVAKALPLLWKGAEGHITQRECFACHNQGLPIMAFTTARTRGFAVRDEDLRKHLEFIAAFLERNRDNYRKGKGQGGQVDMAGSALLALEQGGWKADANTDAVVEYLLQRDQEHKHWRAVSTRPPSEASHFTATYVAIHALNYWATPDQKERGKARLSAARAWLQRTQAKDTEDRVSRLRALRAAGADDKEIRQAVEELARSQRKDGSWAQTDALDGDAYATGTALAALHEAGSLAVSDPIYRRGLVFLLTTQQKDGSWLVRSRSKPFQKYFESGFPHGKDQFISMAASSWATTALALACPPADRK
jgi:squalene cyclase